MVLPLLAAAIPAIGSIVGGLMAESGKRKEMAAQKEFAQHGVRWKVEDARAAGIHPALAMGASTASFQPVGLGTGIAEGLSGASQDIGRAIDATRTLPEKIDAYTQATQALTLNRMGLENELLASQIRKLNTAGLPPSFPMVEGSNSMPGQGNSGIPGPIIPGLAQAASDDFGDILGDVYGVGHWLTSIASQITGHNPVTHKKPVHPTQGETHAEYLKRMAKNPMY